MKKRIKKWLTMILSLALILGSIQYTPMFTEASEENNSSVSTSDSSVFENDSVFGNVNARSAATPTTRYYTFKEVSNAGGYGYTESISDAGVLTAGFNSQYQEVRYSLPEGVDASTLTKLTLDVTSDNVSSLAIKMLQNLQSRYMQTEHSLMEPSLRAIGTRMEQKLIQREQPLLLQVLPL